MNTIRMRALPKYQALATAITLGLAASHAQAVTFNLGAIEGSLDSQLSLGASWSMRSADPDFIHPANTRNGGINQTGTPTAGLAPGSHVSHGHAGTYTSDDGRLNFKKGETFSKIFKGVHDLELKYGDTGVFLRGKYWYDFELKDESRLLYDIDDHGRSMATRASGAQFLDAFVYHNYLIGDLPGTVRVGKQVISWGESVFIGNSINSINPTDVSAFRRPGAEIKEGLIPVNMIYLSQSLTENLSLEAFYQLEWQQTLLDNCGTFFSTTDGVATGCNNALAISGTDFNRDAPGYLYVRRTADADARDSGQFGIAMRWFVPELHNTEFGAYAMNYHSRTPNLNTQSPGAAGVGPVGNYTVVYPEDVRLYGVSFQTNLGSASLAGELNHRPNMPLSLNTADLLPATLAAGGWNLYAHGQTQGPGFIPGGLLQGYKRVPVTQGQLSLAQTFDRVLGASRMVVAAEAGFNHINGISEGRGDQLRYGRDPIWGTGAMRGAHGFFTRNSWGYRARAGLEYPNAVAGVSLTPNLAWSHDVDGYGPNFNEGAKAVSIGLNAEYLNTYNASISYTDNFGGKYNPITDRDFLTVSVGVNF